MPEYLAPGVYVEEIDTGSKPIEGVSTSTAGMLGVAERGPVDVPILITSFGDYRRWFGERLDPSLYSNPNGRHCYLPDAVEGFFINGGKRVYVTRVLDTRLARPAATTLFDVGPPPLGSTVLLRAARENTGTVANPPLALVLSGTGLASGNSIRIGDGSDAEYRQINAALAAEDVLVPLSFQLSRSHVGAAINVEQFTAAAPLAAFTSVGNSQRGDQTIELNGSAANITGLAANDLLEIGATTNVAEHRFIREVNRLSATNARVRLDSSLMRPYVAATAVRKLTLGAGPPTAQLAPAARAGDTTLLVNSRGGDFDTRTDLVVVTNPTNPTDREVRRIGDLQLMTISPPVAEMYPAGTLVEGVTLADDNSLTLTAAAVLPTNQIEISDVTTLVAGQTILVGPAASLETVTIQSINPATRVVTLSANLVTAKAIGNLVIPVRRLTAPANSGSTFIALDNRMGLVDQDVLRIGAAPNEEYVRISGLPNRAPAGVGPDPGNVLLAGPLIRSYAVAGTPIVRQAGVTATALQPTFLVLAAASGSARLVLSDGNGYAPPAPPAVAFVSLTTSTGSSFHRITALNPTAPQEVTLDAPLGISHSVGSVVEERRRALNI